MDYNNYNIKSKTGTFYLSSPDPKEGFKPVETEKFGTRYHKEVEKIGGILHSVAIQEVTFQGKKFKRLKVSFDEESTYGSLAVDIFTPSKRIDEWAKGIAMYLKGLELGQNIVMSLNKTKKEDNGIYLKKYIYFNLADGQNIPWATPFTESPPVAKVKDPVTDEEVTDWTANTKFWFDLIKEQCERLTPQRAAQGQGEPEPVLLDGEDEEMELPF